MPEDNITVGSPVKIVGGTYEGRYGEVQKVTPQKAAVLLASPKKEVAKYIMKHNVQLLDCSATARAVGTGSPTASATTASPNTSASPSRPHRSTAAAPPAAAAEPATPPANVNTAPEHSSRPPMAMPMEGFREQVDRLDLENILPGSMGGKDDAAAYTAAMRGDAYLKVLIIKELERRGEKDKARITSMKAEIESNKFLARGSLTLLKGTRLEPIVATHLERDRIHEVATVLEAAISVLFEKKALEEVEAAVAFLIDMYEDTVAAWDPNPVGRLAELMAQKKWTTSIDVQEHEGGFLATARMSNNKGESHEASGIAKSKGAARRDAADAVLRSAKIEFRRAPHTYHPMPPPVTAAASSAAVAAVAQESTTEMRLKENDMRCNFRDGEGPWYAPMLASPSLCSHAIHVAHCPYLPRDWFERKRTTTLHRLLMMPRLLPAFFKDVKVFSCDAVKKVVIIDAREVVHVFADDVDGGKAFAKAREYILSAKPDSAAVSQQEAGVPSSPHPSPPPSPPHPSEAVSRSLRSTAIRVLLLAAGLYGFVAVFAVPFAQGFTSSLASQAATSE